eukprot:5539138-Pyramimonas_sp.AAC.1
MPSTHAWFGALLARFRGPIGSSTEGPSSRVHMQLPAHPMFISAHTFRGPVGSSTEGPNGSVHMRLPTHR